MWVGNGLQPAPSAEPAVVGIRGGIAAQTGQQVGGKVAIFPAEQGDAGRDLGLAAGLGPDPVVPAIFSRAAPEGLGEGQEG
jgi:hypothetical protein